MICCHRKHFGEKPGELLDYTAAYIGNRIVEPIDFSPLKIAIGHLQNDQQEKNWNGKNYRVHRH